MSEAVPPGRSSAGALVLQAGANSKNQQAASALAATDSAPVMPTRSVAAASELPTPAAEAPSPAPAPAPAAEAPPDDQPPLPAGWEAVVSKSSGDRYYKNVATGETTWDFPADPASLELPATLGAAPGDTRSPQEEPAAFAQDGESHLDYGPAVDDGGAGQPEAAAEPSPEPSPEPEPEPASPDAVTLDVGDGGETSPLIKGNEDTDELLAKHCGFIPQPVRNCISAVWTSCIWMVLRTLWDIVPWLVPFGFFMQSLSLSVDAEERGQLVVLLLFLATPMISMRYHGNSEAARHSLGDGWNIAFVACGTLLTVLFVQVFLFILYDDIDSFLELDLGSSNKTVVINATSLSDPLEFGAAIFAGKLLPEQFSDILDSYAFGKIFLAAPPVIVVMLVLVLNCCSRCRKSGRTIANDALSSELYSVGFFLWFYSAWLMLMHTKSDGDYFAAKTTEELRRQVQSIDSVETVSYLVNACAIIFTSFSIAVQESSDPTKANDISKPLPSKSFSSALGSEGMFWLLCMWLNGTIALLSTFSWTYRRPDASIWPYFVGLTVSLAYIIVYWYHVVWWYPVLTDKHKQVTEALAVEKFEVQKKRGCLDCAPMFSPESDMFYRKQAFVVIMDLASQAGRSWLLLAVAAGSRFGFTRSVGNVAFLVAFMCLILAHAALSAVYSKGSVKRSPYAAMKADLLFEEMYIVGGLAVSVYLWNDSRGLPLCSAFSSHWAHVVTVFVPLILSLWALPTVITRSAIFMPEKRPSIAALRLLFRRIDKNDDKTLDRKEIKELCENMGVDLDDSELDQVMSQLKTGDKRQKDGVTFEEFSLWAADSWRQLPKLNSAMIKLKATGLKENANPKPLDGPRLCTYLIFIGICAVAVVLVGVYGAVLMDEDKNRLPFHSSMDQGMVHTTNATFGSTFEDYDAFGIEPDTTASFIVLDKYTTLRFEEVGVPKEATVTSAAISFVPYLPGDERNPSQTDYCSDTNDLGGSTHPDGISPTSVSAWDNTVALPAGVDLSSVVVGQRMRLGDADGEVCPVVPKDVDFFVQSVAGSTIVFDANIATGAAAAEAQEKCVLRRPVCTSPMQINQGNLRIKAHKGAVATSIDPPPKGAEGAVGQIVQQVPFVGAQNFVISGLEEMIEEVTSDENWSSGNSMQFYLELLPALSAEDGAPVQAQSAACMSAEPAGSSCYFPKQLLAASCDSPQLTVEYLVAGGVEEVTAVIWPKAPIMLDF